MDAVLTNLYGIAKQMSFGFNIYTPEKPLLPIVYVAIRKEQESNLPP